MAFVFGFRKHNCTAVMLSNSVSTTLEFYDDYLITYG
jgi:hypothetical protein